MKKRIGSRIYDTDTSELVCSIEGGQLYQKRSRGREWFAVMNDGTIRPLDVYNPMDMLLMETGKLPADLTKAEPKEYRVRLDAETYDLVSEAAESEGVSMSQIVRRAVLHELN